MNAPSFDLEPADAAAPPPRRIGGWIALWAILGLIIGSQLYGYFDRKPSSGKKTFAISQQYRTIVLSKEAARRFKSIFPDTAGAMTPLDDAIGQVVAARKTDAGAARLYVSMRHEAGQPVGPEDLELLQKSKLPEERAFAEIYAAKSLTQEQARTLAAKLDKRGFSYVMAEIHAREKAGEKEVRRELLADADVYGPLIFGVMAITGMFLGVALLTFYGVMRMAGRFKPEGHPSGKIDASRANLLAAAAALFLFLSLFLGAPISILLETFLIEDAAGLIAQVFTIGLVVHLALRFRERVGLSAGQIFGERGRFWGDVAWGVGGFLANIPLFVCGALAGRGLFSWLPDPEHPVTTQLAADQSLPTVLMILTLACVLAPIFEEMVFRGAIVPAMGHLFGGPLMGVVAAGLIFAMVHPTGIPAWLPLAIIGSTAAILVYQRGSLRAAMIFHAVHNFSLLAVNVMLN